MQFGKLRRGLKVLPTITDTAGLVVSHGRLNRAGDGRGRAEVHEHLGYGSFIEFQAKGLRVWIKKAQDGGHAEEFKQILG